MSTDPFDDLLDLENEYYQEGYDAGVADSTYAGMIEGKVFGIEKGYEKALELGKLQGRARVWQRRSERRDTDPAESNADPSMLSDSSTLAETMSNVLPLPDNARLRKQVDGLVSASESSKSAKDNSDEAVTNFDDQIARSKAKAKVIANITGESISPASNTTNGIEEATGLNARH